MRGTWQTTGGRSAAPVLLILGVLLLAGSGGAIAAAGAVIDALFAAVAVVFLTAVALTVFLVRRARHGSPLVPVPVRYELPGPERPALPQHLHLHFDGADPAAVAEILRRHQAQ